MLFGTCTTALYKLLALALQHAWIVLPNRALLVVKIQINAKQTNNPT